jgi:hypothetical protein
MAHLTSGTLTSVSGLSGSIARNLDRLTMDGDHARRREEEKRSGNQREGVVGSVFSGVKDVGQSVLSGAAGLVVEPVKGVQTDGVLSFGLFKGLGKGVVGAVTKPIGSVFDLVASAGQGIQNSAGLSGERSAEDEMLARLRSDLDIPFLSSAAASASIGSPRDQHPSGSDDDAVVHAGDAGSGARAPVLLLVASAIEPVQAAGPVTLLFVDRCMFEMDREGGL